VRLLGLTAARGRRLFIALVAGAFACAWSLGCGSTGAATTDAAVTSAGGLRLVRVGTFDQPTYVAGAPGDDHRLFVVEKAGTIVVLVNGPRRSRPFLDITKLVDSSDAEQGLLSMAFAPD
jgi:hypothetical protein